MTAYAQPDVLVSTQWVREHLDDPTVKVVEVDADDRAYRSAHIPGALHLDWGSDLQDPVVRDIISQPEFEKRIGGLGIRPEDTVVLYGGANNWFAAYAFWIFRYYCHRDVRLMNGGRARWLSEPGQKLVEEVLEPTPVTYRVEAVDNSVRAMLMEVMQQLSTGEVAFVDARTPDEYTGRVLAATGMRDSAQRGGHIPGAVNLPWSATVNADGTFKSADELRRLVERKGLDPARPTVVYCSSGERASCAWFVLEFLLGFSNVKTYDGSWAEYGSIIGAPIER